MKQEYSHILNEFGFEIENISNNQAVFILGQLPKRRKYIISSVNGYSIDDIQAIAAEAAIAAIDRDLT